MSLSTIGAVWVIPFFPPSTKLVALHLADSSDESGRSWHSYDSIARRCGLSRGSVKRIVNHLIEQGWITRDARSRKNGSSTSNILRWNFEKLDREAGVQRQEMKNTRTVFRDEPPEVEDDAGSRTGGFTHEPPPGSPMTPPRVTHEPPGGFTHEPPSNPKEEPPRKPKRRKKEVRSVSSVEELRQYVVAFAGVYESRFKSRYIPNPNADLEAAAALKASGIEPKEVRSLFLAASKTKGFWSSKTVTLPMLVKRWNEIQAEVRDASTTTQAGQSAEEWAREIAEVPVEG